MTSAINSVLAHMIKSWIVGFFPFQISFSPNKRHSPQIERLSVDYIVIMSLMLLKTKNLSWQDHTLNIEVMMSPQGHTLLLNKHKALDTKAERQRAIFERERQSCLKRYTLEERLIKRQRQSLHMRKEEVEEARSKSAAENHGQGTGGGEDDASAGRTLSAPTHCKTRTGPDDNDSSSFSGSDLFRSQFTKPPLKTGSLFGATVFKQRVISDVTQTEAGSSAMPEPVTTAHKQPRPGFDDDELNHGVFITETRKSPVSASQTTGNMSSMKQTVSHQVMDNTSMPPIPLQRRNATVTFKSHVSQRDETKHGTGVVSVEIHKTSVEDKVRTFLKEQEAFNRRPATSGPNGSYRNEQLTFNFRTPNPTSRPLVANKYTRLTVETKLLERSFDRFCESQSFEDLLKTMKLASKMKAQVRQARNTSLVPTMAVFKSTKTFMTLLARKQRKEKEQCAHAK
ncbi:unnamed protein product [Lymnaea stagnalis]|uniref:Uncharacterized protein n=1 Tax=Lymnaea stagnalis TaxID=6523 RepID=A0AAV2IL31_LYMST